jgi:hypothetical protein
MLRNREKTYYSKYLLYVNAAKAFHYTRRAQVLRSAVAALPLQTVPPRVHGAALRQRHAVAVATRHLQAAAAAVPLRQCTSSCFVADGK